MAVVHSILRGMREYHGMSQERLAEIIDWRQEYVSQVELGKKLLPKDKAEAIAKLLRVLPKDLPVADD